MDTPKEKTDFSDHRIIGLDVLRACSILFVLLSHGGGFFLRSFPQLLTPVVYFGVLGVEIFFILSGYLIGTIIIKHFRNAYSHSSAFTFLIRRWFRTVPNYLLFLFINILYFYYFKRDAGESGQLTSVILRHLSFTQNFLSFNNPTFFPESWSLAIEEWFYIIIVLLIGILSRIFRISPSYAIIGSFVILVISPLVLRHYYIVEFNSTWWQVTRTSILHLDSIIWGFGLAILNSHYAVNIRNIRYISCAVGVGILTTSTYLFCSMYANSLLDASISARLLLPPLFSVAITALVPFFINLEIKSQVIQKPIVYTSLWSYSLYLSNLLVFHLVDEMISIKNPCLQYIMFVVICFTVSGIVYHFFESPITKVRERFNHREVYHRDAE